MSSTSEIKFRVEPEFCDVDWDLKERLILYDLNLKYLLSVAAKIDGVACDHEVTDSTDRMILSGPKADLDVFKESISSSQRVTLSFLIPNRLRGIVIGSRGRLLKHTSRRHLVEIFVRRLQWDPFGNRFGKIREPRRNIAVPTFPNDNDDFFKYPQTASVIVQGTLQNCLNAKHDIIDDIKKAIERVEIMLDFPYELKRWSKSVTEPVMLKYPDIQFPLCSSEEGGFLLFTKMEVMVEVVASFQLQLKELQGNIGICLVPVPRALHQLMPQYLTSFPDVDFYYPPEIENSDYEERGIKLAGDPSEISRASNYLMRFSQKFGLYEIDLVDLFSHDIRVLKAVVHFLSRKLARSEKVLVYYPSYEHLCDISKRNVPIQIVGRKGQEMELAIDRINSKIKTFLKREIYLVTDLPYCRVYTALQSNWHDIEYCSMIRWGIIFCKRIETPNVLDQLQLDLVMKKINEAKAHSERDSDNIITISPADQAAMLNSNGQLIPAVLKNFPGAFLNPVYEVEGKFGIEVVNGSIAIVKQITISGVRMLVMKAREHLIAKVNSLKKESVKRVRLASTWQCRAPGFNFLSFSKLQKTYNVNIRLYCETMKGVWPHPSQEDEITIQGPSGAFEKVEQEIDRLVQYEADHFDFMTYEVPFFAIKRAIFELEPWYKSKFEGYGVEYRWVDEYDGRSTGTYRLEASGCKDRLDKLRDELDYQIEQETLNYSAFCAIIHVPDVLQPELETFYLSDIFEDTLWGDESELLEQIGEDFMLSIGNELALEKVIQRIETWTKKTIELDRNMGFDFI
ncbi:hypothetical protein C7M61_000872 [Candidozyma pseudohaemuli]|uniref:K Homology domain-containing protein n=1 Tax=Candidozyma pseudohaemuli TaxID=418784 RepID=A0A2P7YZ07_9ASCO|nr:hypothetical protein C7M61_000872 [[Candida] pseudohaemulonii]PSK41197.1 hypothetical protein C7M61_000872 [[Candida] pseudohaemulonii]